MKDFNVLLDSIVFLNEMLRELGEDWELGDANDVDLTIKIHESGPKHPARSISLKSS